VEAEVIPEAPFTEVDTPEEDTVVPFAKPTPEAPVADIPVAPPAPSVEVEAPEEVAAAPADDEPAELTDNPPTEDDAALAAAEPEPHQVEAEPEPEHPEAPEAASLATDDDAPTSPEAPAQPQEDSRRQARFTFSSEEPGLPFDFPEPAPEPAAETAAPEEATEDSSEETIPAASQPAESEPETSPALALPDAADLSKVSAKPGLLAYARQIRTTPPEDQATILAALPALKALADQLGQAPQ
jgi:nicotinate-nucleotide--dimethylbenzimidazole phosphoribosyltransferase